MRPGRLAVLVGTLLAAGALYLRHLVVDGAAFSAATGNGVPSIWQELGKWGRPTAAVLAAALVATSFRPNEGLLDRVGAAAAVLLAAAGAAGALAARQAAADDAAVLSAALGSTPASAGVGYWVLLAGAVGAAAGAVWDLAAAWGIGPARRAASVGEEDAAAVQ